MSRHATADELATATRAGVQAWEAEAPCAPILSLTLHGLIEDAKVGEPRTLELFKAFTDAYRREVAQAVPAGVWA